MNRFDQQTIATMRAVLQEAAQELHATPATQAKIAETLVLKAAEGDVSREELKDTALEAGRTPAE
jgi:hypothetical protein